jgi:plasmid stabilization system protein ParE
MNRVWTQEALERLREIKRYIAGDHPDRAADFIGAIIDRSELLSTTPYTGRIVPEQSRGLFVYTIQHSFFRLP